MFTSIVSDYTIYEVVINVDASLYGLLTLISILFQKNQWTDQSAPDWEC